MTVTEEPTAPAEAHDEKPEATVPAVVDHEERRARELGERQAAAVDAVAEAALAMPGMAGRDEFISLAMQAKLLSMSGAAPKAIKGRPHVALHIAMIGRDLGISPSAAVELIDVVGTEGNERPSLSPQLINGQIRRLGLGAVDRALLTDDRCVAVAVAPGGRLDSRCKDEAKRTGDWPVHVDGCGCHGLLGDTEFTWAEAKQAGLVDNRCTDALHHWVKQGTSGRSKDDRCWCATGWRTYPKRLLWWRAAGYCADDWFPEAGLGLYCVPRRAEALTRDGWIGPDKLQVGDDVLAYDADADVCRWTPVTAVHVYDAAQTYRIEHDRWRFTATAGHRWVIRRKGWPSNRDPGREFRETRSIQRGAGVVILAAELEGGGQGLSDRDGAILGWLLTDGSFYWRPGRRGGEVRGSIVQAKHVETLRALLGDDATEGVMFPERIGSIKGREYHMRETFTFRLRAAFLRPLMVRAGIRSKADAAKIVARLSPSGRAAMLEAMLLANGHDAGKGPSGQKHVTFHTGNRDVLGAFQSLAACQGIGLGHERFTNGCWTVTLRRSAGVETASLSVAEHDVEPVWCPTTALGTWVCRLDGYVAITGNSSEELGAVVDVDGRAIDPATVELPDGYERQGSTGGGSGGGEDRVADPDVLWSVQLRVHALPEDAQAEFKKRWMQAKIPGRLTAFPAAKDKLVESLLRGVEQQWKARGAYDPETGPAQFAENVLAPAVAAACRSWASQAAVAAPEPESAPDTAAPAPAAPAPAESTPAAEPDQTVEAADGTLPLDAAAGDPTDGLLAIPDTIRAADDDVQFEWLEAYVKMMRVGEVDTLLRDRYGESTKGSPTERRERLAEQIAVRELGKQHPDHMDSGGR